MYYYMKNTHTVQIMVGFGFPETRQIIVTFVSGPAWTFVRSLRISTVGGTRGAKNVEEIFRRRTLCNIYLSPDPEMINEF